MYMQQEVIQADSLSNRIRIKILDSTTFMGKTGLAWNTAALSFYYSNGPSDTAHALALVTNTVGGAWTDGGFVEVDATHEPGWYQLDVKNLVVAAVIGSKAQITWKGTGILDGAVDIALPAFNPFALDKANVSLSTAGILALWNQLTASLTTAATIGKLLVDNVALGTTNSTAIKAKTDALLLTAGRVEIAPHGLDNAIGYHPAGDA